MKRDIDIKEFPIGEEAKELLSVMMKNEEKIFKGDGKK